MIRSLAAVIAGYLVFSISAVLLFQLAHRPPGVWPGAGFVVFSILYGAAFAALAGWVAARLAPKSRFAHAGVVAGLLGAVALVSLLAQLHKASLWSQWSALIAFPPCVLLGGYLGARSAYRR